MWLVFPSRSACSQSQASLGQMYIVDYLTNGMPRDEVIVRFAIGYDSREFTGFDLRLCMLT